MKINIQTDKNNLKNNNTLFNDYYLNELVIFYINTENRTNISTFIRSIFYLDLNEEYYETYLDFSALYPIESDKFLFIYNLFNEWNPSEKYSMYRWRGIFLELLTYTLLKQVYSEEEINRESLVTIDKFRTNPIDFTELPHLIGRQVKTISKEMKKHTDEAFKAIYDFDSAIKVSGGNLKEDVVKFLFMTYNTFGIISNQLIKHFVDKMLKEAITAQEYGYNLYKRIDAGLNVLYVDATYVATDSTGGYNSCYTFV